MVSRSQSPDHSAAAFLFDRVADEKPRKLADLPMMRKAHSAGTAVDYFAAE
jgi:hypothetical protein